MVEQLRDLYHGEKRLEELLPLMIQNSCDSELRLILNDYHQMNEEQIMRIRQAFEFLYVPKRGETCDAMIAMAREAEALIVRCGNEEVRDAALLTVLQHIIHYQIAGYGAVCTYAQMLDFDHIAALIHLNLEEEKIVDQRLIRLAERSINLQAI